MKYFKYFCIKFALSFRFFDSWYIIKYLLTETSGKQYRQSRVHKTYCFPRSQSISVNCYVANAKTKRDWLIRGHVALDKCNVSPRETSKKLLPGCEYKKNKMAA